MDESGETVLGRKGLEAGRVGLMDLRMSASSSCEVS